jgi:hypothetical protein
MTGWAHPVRVHLLVLAGYLAAGIAVTWPHATYLTGRIPDTRDAGSYVWGFWWMAHVVLHLSDPWVTNYIAAPVGTQLGLHALMPLVGAVMAPVTIVFGPSASFNLLSVLLPGLLGYAMWRVARLWLPSQVGALAAGAFFGFAAIIDFQTWVHLNLAAGALCLPITLEACVRFRRRPKFPQAIVLGLVVGASMLVDQESAILCVALAAAALLSWLVLPSEPRQRKLRVPAPAGPGGPAGPDVVTEAPAGPDLMADLPTEPRPAAPAPATEPPPAPPAEPLEPAPEPRLARILRLARELPQRAILAVKELPDRLKTVPQRSVLLMRSVPPLARELPARAVKTIRALPSRIGWLKLGVIAVAGLVAILVAAPQLVAIVHANQGGSPSADLSAGAYLYGIRLPDMFLPSPRITSFGLHFTHAQNSSTYGALPTLLALTGLVLAWRKRSAWLLAIFWLCAALLAVGSDIILPFGTVTPFPQTLNGVQVSAILPFTWFARIPGLSGFREPSRIAELGLLSVALLAGYTVSWLRFHAKPLLVVVLVLGVFEAGLTTPPDHATMPTSLPALDNPIAADRSNSVVLDIPFGLRGGTGVTGLPFAAESQVLATNDGHPLADALLSRVSLATKNAIDQQPFYADLMNAQTGHYNLTPAQFMTAAKSAVHMHIGWVLLWVANKHLRNFLVETGFHYVYRADNVSVWRPDGYANAAMPTASASP